MRTGSECSGKVINNPPQGFTNLYALMDNANIRTRITAANYYELEAHDGTNWVPVLRVQNDSVPRIEVIAAGGLLFGAGGPGAIEGQVNYDSTSHKLQVRTNAGVETITSA